MANQDKTNEREEFHPKGTLAFLLIFVLLIVVLWGSVYLILLSRGVTV